MAHPLVEQLRFARAEFLRGLGGLSSDDACRRVGPMNSIGWNVGHMAWQEQRYWLFRGQGRILVPEVQRVFANGAPASTPALDQVMADWRAITAAADPWLDGLTSDALAQLRDFDVDGQTIRLRFGSLLQRTTYHYWYHTGENMAIRQMLGHTDLPEFVGNIDDEAPYRPEADRTVAVAGGSLGM
jgi:uncharacterized damage-inducible protein DinB